MVLSTIAFALFAAASVVAQNSSSSVATLASSPGFSNSSSKAPVSLPLTVALQPGISLYAATNYGGEGSFSALPTSPIVNTSVSITADSLSISQNVWVAVTAGSASNRVILWDSVPDFTQLPASSSGLLALVDMESSACSPPCSGSGVCSAAGTCTCPTGFNGTSCETCSTGFFGPTCQTCPSGCTTCDDGISGSGRCLSAPVSNPPASCNCLNGQCGSNGQCTCLPGWTAGSNGTACAQCATGFFLDSAGNCEVCGLGCASCAATTGDCVTCSTGFTQDTSDLTKCDAAAQTKSDGTACPAGSFSSSGTCTACSAECQTCTGATSNECVVCATGKLSFNGTCVSTDSNGICSGSNLIANNNKKECDTCGPKCTTCQIPNFTVASTIDQAQCTGCLSGFVLSGGKCISSCPTGTFLSPTDNLTCTACDSSCSTCAGSSKFCLTCTNSQLASAGSCVSSCPSTSFSSSGVCTTCHPDCATCSGPSFSQCSSCSAGRPVLTNGRCLPTCSKGQFFDKTGSTCQNCDSSCSSCSGSGPASCLACSSSTQVLRAGSCVAASCNGTSTTSTGSVIPGLGVCLSDLVIVPTPSGTSSAAPVPSITGLTDPTPINTSTSRRLTWWEILLMALGCAFIFLCVLMCWRRRARKNRAKRTARFAQVKALDPKSTNWFVRFGEKLFGHGPRAGPLPPRRYGGADGGDDAKRMLNEDTIRSREMDDLIDSYKFSDTKASSHHEPAQSIQQLEADSIYSQMTGQPRRQPEPRQPVRSRFSGTTTASGSTASTAQRELRRVPAPAASKAELYAASVRHEPDAPKGSYWVTPVGTGNTNPFRLPSP
ncbi:growth factor receptor domain-containing protein [Athelia psychrophila]|uniref:Growth factor receptor domain-containing protein n=1 Tax=Athelia psychrophila TaxID=1759441 RepID=A0A166CLE4_9AGAM|nr:growth factor receptor domain-containing protein [Fibularhizoctonia sp. CBS 109695]